MKQNQRFFRRTILYSLVVSFEAVQSNIPIYSSFAEVQVDALQVQKQVKIRVTN